MIIERKHLLAQLAVAKQARGRRTSVEILRCVRLDVDGSQAYIEATDMDQQVRLPLAVVESFSRFDTLINLDELVDLLKAMPYSQVWIDETAPPDPLVMVASSEAETTEATIMAVPREDWPQLEWIGPDGDKPEGEVILSAHDLAKVAAVVAPAFSRDETRPVLTGVGIDLHTEGEAAVFAASDSYRLHVVHGGMVTRALPDTKGTTHQSIGIGLGKWLVQVAKYAKQTSADTVTLTMSGRRWVATFAGSDTAIGCRRIDGQFPAYDKLMPSSCEFEVSFDPEGLALAAKACKAKAESKTQPMIIAYEDGKWLATTPRRDVVIPLLVNGESSTPPAMPWRIGLNPEFLLDAAGMLGKLDDAQTNLIARFQTELRPVLLERADAQCLLMPIRLANYVQPADAKVEKPGVRVTGKGERDEAEGEGAGEPVSDEASSGSPADGRQAGSPATPGQPTSAKDKPRNVFLAAARDHAKTSYRVQEKKVYALQVAGWLMAERKTEPKKPEQMRLGEAMAIQSRLRRIAQEVGYTPFTKS